MTAYQPTEEDLDFFRNLIRVMKDGGTWAVPYSGAIYQVDKTNEVLRLKLPTWDTTPMMIHCHHRADYCMRALGWKITPEVNWNEVEVPTE